MTTPATTSQWTIQGVDGFDSLKLEESAPLPQLGDHDCLIQIEAVSLNYRDLSIPKASHSCPSNPIVPPPTTTTNGSILS